MSSNVEGILAIIRARPGDIEQIVQMAIERYPEESGDITARVIGAFPDQAAAVAAVAAGAAPQYGAMLIEQAIRANPAQADQIAEGARRGNPALASHPFYAGETDRPEQQATEPDVPGSPRFGQHPLDYDPEKTEVDPASQPAPRRTVIEEPAYQASAPARQTIVEEPVFPAAAQSVRSESSGPPQTPVSAGPMYPETYESPPGGNGSERRWLTCAVIGVLLLLAVVCGAAVTMLAANQLGTFSLQPRATQTPVPFDPLDQTLTAISSEVTLTSPAFEATATPEPDPDQPEATATTDPAEFFPSDTPAPTAQPPTATSDVPMFTLSQGAFCRDGPSTIYRDRIAVQAGETLPISGRGISPVDNVSVWWQVRVGALACFISSTLGTTSGNLATVPDVPAPPTPTPTSTATQTSTPTLTLTPTP